MLKCFGDFVMLCDVVDEVGCDLVCFMMIYCKNFELFDFDFVKVIEYFKDNLVFYV